MTKNQEEYYKAYFASIDFNETIDVSKLKIKGYTDLTGQGNDLKTNNFLFPEPDKTVKNPMSELWY